MTLHRIRSTYTFQKDDVKDVLRKAQKMMDNNAAKAALKAERAARRLRASASKAGSCGEASSSSSSAASRSPSLPEVLTQCVTDYRRLFTSLELLPDLANLTKKQRKKVQQLLPQSAQQKKLQRQPPAGARQPPAGARQPPPGAQLVPVGYHGGIITFD